MADWQESIELPLLEPDREWARAAAEVLARRREDGRTTDRLASTYWTPYEADLYGRIGEAAVHRLLGTALPDPESFYERQNDGGADVADRSIGIKTAPWRCIEHFHLIRGGRLVVPIRSYGLSHTYVLCTYFLKSQRAYLDGYASADMINGAARLRSNRGKPAVELAYADLLPAQHWPHLP